VAAIATLAALAWTSPYSQVVIIAAGALAGRLLLAPPPERETGPEPSPVSRQVGIVALVVFFALLAGLPLLCAISDSQGLALFEAFYRTGSLVFGGGHVMLPLLHGTVVAPGWVTDTRFLAGYGATQAVPGPLFTFAAYLGAVMRLPPSGFLGATIALVAIFLPAFLLIWGTLPFWDVMRRSVGFRRALSGTNAAVVGILLAAFYTPIWTSAIGAPIDLAIAAVALALLVVRRAPPIVVVLLAAVAGQIVG
jgi:chromate transporter